ncbi:disulfide bond formation protein B [Hydromonas duriensis]|uniref:Thiol:disulfide interchange protein DsbB n=1 Tax=Hydromonas duriensis TaxID=1527608 RepID=A0A4R6Y6G6_9BURK|nr:disulfide bond formation protein B [Hydromonas duriensis]TDR30524.1 thiol:disulfide interchange protein DsbB [Hydromonas duriensis]
MNRKSKVKPLFSRRVKTHRLAYALLLILSTASLGAAWYLQNVKDLAPCPLCIMQRFGFWAFALFSVMGLIKGHLGRLSSVVAIFSGVCATGVAAYHNWVLMQPKTECGIDPVQNVVNQLPTAQWWPDMFMATGMCGAKLPLYFGVSIPQWSLVVLLSSTLIFLLILLKK